MLQGWVVFSPCLSCNGDPPGPLPGQSVDWGTYCNHPVCRVLIRANPGPPAKDLCDSLRAQLNLEMGSYECTAFLGYLISTSFLN